MCVRETFGVVGNKGQMRLDLRLVDWIRDSKQLLEK